MKLVMMSSSLLFVCQREVLVGRRIGVPLDQAEPRFLDPRTDAVEEAQLPQRREHRALVHELLHLVQRRFAPTVIELGGLFGKQRVEVRIAAVDKGAALRDEGLEARGGVAEGAARALDQVLEALLGVSLVKSRALERPEL